MDINTYFFVHMLHNGKRLLWFVCRCVCARARSIHIFKIGVPQDFVMFRLWGLACSLNCGNRQCIGGLCVYCVCLRACVRVYRVCVGRGGGYWRVGVYRKCVQVACGVGIHWARERATSKGLQVAYR